jgi:hypothetical protein
MPAKTRAFAKLESLSQLINPTRPSEEDDCDAFRTQDSSSPQPPQIPLNVKLDVAGGSSINETLTSERLALQFIEPKKRDVPLPYIPLLVKQVV